MFRFLPEDFMTFRISDLQDFQSNIGLFMKVFQFFLIKIFKLVFENDVFKISSNEKRRIEEVFQPNFFGYNMLETFLQNERNIFSPKEVILSPPKKVSLHQTEK